MTVETKLSNLPEIEFDDYLDEDLNSNIMKAPYYKEYVEWNNRWGNKVGTYDEKGMYIPKMDPKTGCLIWNSDWDWDWED